MAIRARRDDDDLEPDDATIGERTFLGGLGAGARSWLFFLACLLAAAAFTALYVHVDRDMDAALDGMQQASRIDELTNAVERGTYSLQARQREFLLNRDTGIADAFGADLAQVSAALDELFSIPGARPLAQHVTTIRDGLVQYEQQFQSFVAAEREIGLGTESGLSARLAETSRALGDVFEETGNRNLINQIERIDEQGEETLLSGSKKGVEEIRRRYDALTAFVAAAQMPDDARNRIAELLKVHETQMLSMINARFQLAEQSRRFDELFDYVVPSLNGLAGFAERNRIEAAANVRNMQLYARYTILGGTAAIVLWLLFFGLLLIKSLSGPARRLADALERIARGAQHVSIPAQGNRDDFGRIARLMDGWADTIIEADRLRGDLERTKHRLDRISEAGAGTDARVGEAEDRARNAEIRAQEAEARARDAEERADRAETLASRALPAPATTPPPEDAPPEAPPPEDEPRRLSALEAFRLAEGEAPPGGPISSVSQQLQNFTQYVTAAANDVERTEALIRGVEQLTHLVEDIGDLVIAIRDQTNLLAFRGPGKDALRDAGHDDETLVAFSGEGNRDAERVYAQRFDQLRDATERTERTVRRLREVLDGVSEIARDIAETASHQALDATHKLLSQSEYLQNMLDDILNKIHPAKPGALSAPRPPRRAGDDPFQ